MTKAKKAAKTFYNVHNSRCAFLTAACLNISNSQSIFFASCVDVSAADKHKARETFGGEIRRDKKTNITVGGII